MSIPLQKYGVLQEDEATPRKLSSKEVPKVTIKDLIKGFEFRKISFKDLFNLNLKDYLKYMETLPLAEQQKLIDKYLTWYTKFDDFDLFKNLIVKRREFFVKKVAIFPDGKRLAISDLTDDVIIYDLEKKSEILRFRELPYGSIVFSFDHQIMSYVRSDDYSIILFNTKTLLIEKKLEFPSSVYNEPIFSKTDYAMAVLIDLTVFIKEDSKEFKATELDSIKCGDFTRKTPGIFCYAFAKNIIVWNYRTGTNLCKFAVDAKVNYLVFSDCGSKLITACEDNLIRIYYFGTQKEGPILKTNYQKQDKVLTLKGHTKAINFLLTSPNEQFILTTEWSEDSICGTNVFLWREKNNEEWIPDIYRFDNEISDFKWTDNKFMGASISKEIVYIDPFSKKLQKNKDSVPLTDCIYSPKQDFLLSLLSKNKLALINEKTGMINKVFTLTEKDERFNGSSYLRFSMDGARVMARTSKRLNYIYDVYGPSTNPTCKPLSTQEDSSSITAFFGLKNGKLIVGYENGDIGALEEKSSKNEKFEVSHGSRIVSINFDLNEEIMVTGDYDGKIYFWDKNFKKIKEKDITHEDLRLLYFSKRIKEHLFILTKSFEIYDLNKNSVVENSKLENIFDYYDMTLTTSIDEELLYVGIINYEIMILQKITDKYCVARKFSNLAGNLQGVWPHPQDKNTIVCKFYHGIYEIKNAVESIKTKMTGTIYYGDTKMISMKDDEKFIFQLFDMKKMIALSEEVKTDIKKPRDCIFSVDEKSLLIVDDDGEYWVWNLEKRVVTDNFKKEGENFYNFMTARPKKKTKPIIWANSNPILFEWVMGKPLFSKEVFQSPQKFKSIDYSFDDKKLLLVLQDIMLILNSNDYKEEVKITFGDKDSIYSGKFSWSDYKIYVDIITSGENVINIYDGTNGSCLKSVKPPYSSFQKYFNEPQTDGILFAYSDKAALWRPADEMSQLIYWQEDENTEFHLTPNSDLFAYQTYQTTTGINFRVYFNISENESLMMQERNIIKELIETKEDKESKAFRNYEMLSFPFNFNLLQICAYQKSFRKDFFEDIYPPHLLFDKDLHQRNCFEIASMLKDSKLFTDFLNYILKNTTIDELVNLMLTQKNRYFDSKFFMKLFGIFEDDPSLVKTFLNFLYVPITTHEEEYPQISLKRPIVATTTESSITKELLISEVGKHQKFVDESAQMKELVKTKIFFCDAFLKVHQKGTIDMFKLISDFEPTNEIFSHQALIDLLQYKWEKYARRIYFTEAFGFLALLAIYLLNANYFLLERLQDETNGVSSQTYIYSLIVDAIVMCFVIYHFYIESQQLILSKLKYFSSIWNIIDVILILFMSVTTLCDILSCFEVWTYQNALRVMHSFTIFFLYLRIFSYARGVEGSSFMIKLILQVVFDIRYFLLLMFLFIFALTSSVYVIQSNFDYNILDVFLSFFREMIGDLGDFDEIAQEVNYLWVLYFFFFAATILLTISMLNLLIAIISDTFSKVKNAENLTKIWERWNIITEIDEIIYAKGKMIANVKDEENQYILVIYNDCHYKNEINETLEIKKSIEQLKSKSDTEFEKTEKTLAELKKSLETVEKNMDEKMGKILEALTKDENKENKEDKENKEEAKDQKAEEEVKK